MPIIAFPSIHLSPREEVFSTIVMMVNDAADSPDEIRPNELAGEILDFIEENINSVDADGNVIYGI
jgi:hypothetical protein